MKRPFARSEDVDQTLVAPARETPAEADLAFERLYRSSRDDVYAYVAGVLRDRSAAEEVTAAAFERAFRKRGRFDARRGKPVANESPMEHQPVGHEEPQPPSKDLLH